MAETLIDSYPTSNSNGTDSEAISGYANYFQGLGQSFEASVTAPLLKVKWYLKKAFNNPTGNAVAKLYAHSGTFGTSSVPTGAALATSGNVDMSTLTNSFVLYDFNFTGGNQYNLQSGTRYVITFEYSGGNATDYVDIGVDYSSSTHAGNDPYLFSGTWNAETDDCIFYLYADVTASNPTITGVSSITGLGSITI